MGIQVLIGHQEKLPDGHEGLTLADLWPEDRIIAAVVGLNPAPKSVEAGHYYQGQAGRRQLLRMAKMGMFDPDDAPFIDDAALQHGIAFTDIVKFPTPGEKQVSAEQIRAGLPILETSLATRGVPLVIGVFRHPVEALLGLNKSSPGLQEKATSWGAKVFRMPGPYAKADEVERVLLELRYVSREIITDPMFEPVPFATWVEFYKSVLLVAEARGEHPDVWVLRMYTEDVRRSLGELPTPPWHV
jgi:TDG/mug DNA glycosylase family protein